MSRHILIVEDEGEIADIIARFLQKEGYTTTHLDNGSDVAETVKREKPDMMILDLMLPGKDGIAVCKDVRGFSDLPIIMVTAKVSEAERIIGLDVGADDYVCKPFSAVELVMRVNVYFRRFGKQQGSDPIHLDEGSMRVTYADVTIDLTNIEFALLRCLMSKPGNVYSRQFLLDNIYKDHRIVSDRTVDSHIRNLRKKMRQLHDEQEFVESVYGAGYRYIPAE